MPGLVLAAAWADAEGRLLDAQLRRVRFLRRRGGGPGLDDRVEAVHGRAEDLAREPAYRRLVRRRDRPQLRATGVTAECGAPFLRPGGVLLVAEPPGRSATGGRLDGLATLGLVDAGVLGAAAGSVRGLRLAGDLAPSIPAAPRRCSADRTSDLGGRPRQRRLAAMFHGEHPGGPRRSASSPRAACSRGTSSPMSRVEGACHVPAQRE